MHEARWQGVAAFETARAFSPAMPVTLSFEIPADLPVTRLTTTTPVFWELEVALDLPGLDFVETYLVPVY